MYDKLPQSKLTRIQTQIFRCKINNHLEQLQQQYLGMISNYLLEDVRERLHTLMKIVYYLGIFINDENSRLFIQAFQIIRNQIIDKYPIILKKEYLEIIQACGSKDFQMQLTDEGISFIFKENNNQYFQEMFIQPYIKKLIEATPKSNLSEYIGEQREIIKKLYSTSEQTIMNKFIKHIVAEQLKTINYNQVTEVYQLFQFLQVEDEISYKLQQKMTRSKSINPMVELALNYKEYLKQSYNVTNFTELIQLYIEQEQFIETKLNSQKHCMIALNELIEEIGSTQNLSAELFKSHQAKPIGKIISCINQPVDHICAYYLKQLFKLASPYEASFNYDLQLQKIQEIEMYQQNYLNKMKLKELQCFIRLTEQQYELDSGFYFRYPTHLSQIEDIITIPKELEQLLPQSKDKQYQITKYGYACVVYKQEYTIIMNTIQLVTLLSIDQQLVLLQNDKIAMDSLIQIGIVINNQINDNWIPKAKQIVICY